MTLSTRSSTSLLSDATEDSSPNKGSMTVPESKDDAREFQSPFMSEPFLRSPPDLDPGRDASIVETGSDKTKVIANMGGFGAGFMGSRRGFCWPADLSP